MKEGGRPHVRERKRKKGEKKEEELGLRGTLFPSQSGVRRKETAQKGAKGKRACPGFACW